MSLSQTSHVAERPMSFRETSEFGHGSKDAAQWARRSMRRMILSGIGGPVELVTNG
jgi:hypothetical protein